MHTEIYKNREFKIFRLSLWQLFIPLISGIVITLFSYPRGFLSVRFIPFLIIYSLCLGVPCMKIYEYIEWKLERQLQWLVKPNKRFFLSVFLELTVGILILFIINWFIFVVIQKQEISFLISKTSEGLKYLIFLTIAGILIINSFHFFRSWKQAAVNEEKLKIEKLAIEYEALKNQVNPHFLFNSLTALSSLVYKDQEKAIAFIGELSSVYRYVLESREREIVDFQTEKKFLESVLYLNQIRYENSLQVKINLSGETDKYIIPMALQMLLENAIKHNAISVNRPLKVEIFEEEGFIVVKNNMQPKKSEIVTNKIGLENIKSRYKYLSDKEVLVEKSDEEFIVKIPVLSIKHV